MSDLFTTENLIALLTLATLEIVLGIDNIIFIAVLASKLPAEQQDRARQLGIGLAVGSRVLLLLAISWVTRLTEPLIRVLGNDITGRDLILLAGGLFLIAKSTAEIFEKLEAVDEAEEKRTQRAAGNLAGVLAQIVLIDIVFSLDSVITAVGISGVLPVMVLAIIVAAAVMLFFSGPVARFVEHHPSMKILALAFLILIGALLVIEGWNPEIVEQYTLRNYAYFAMAFSVLVELVNIRLRRPAPVQLHNRPRLPEQDAEALAKAD